MQINANATDITKNVPWQSLSIEDNLTSQINLCSFKYRKYGTRAYTPALTHVVQILDDGGNKLFEGKITRITKTVEGRDTLVYNIECMDYTIDLDRELVAETYEDMTVEDIINDSITDNTAGFTINNVSCNIPVDYIAFNYEEVSKCIQRLAELVGYEWYVDYDSDIHFFARGDETAPFNLDDTSGNYIYRSLVLEENYESLRNSIIVRGSTYTGSSIVTRHTSITEGEETADTHEKFAELPSVFVNGVEQTVGLDHVNDPDDYDCLWNYGQKLIKWREDNMPALLDEITIKGRPEIPVILTVEDAASIATYGRREFLIIDKTIKTKEAANDRASAEIEAYKDALEEGSFETYQGGLHSGQQINVASVTRGENTDFIIKQVRTKMRSPGKFTHYVKLVTERTMGIIEFLQKQLREGDRKIEQPSDELIARLVDKTETVTLEERSKKVKGMHTGIHWVWGPHVPAGWMTYTATITDTKRAARFDASCTWI